MLLLPFQCISSSGNSLQTSVDKDNHRSVDGHRVNGASADGGVKETKNGNRPVLNPLHPHLTEDLEETFDHNSIMWKETALVLDKIFGLAQVLVIVGAYLYMLLGYLTANPTVSAL